MELKEVVREMYGQAQTGELPQEAVLASLGWAILDRRIALFVSLALDSLERDVAQREIDKIGRN